MEVKDLRALVNGYNSKKEEIFDKVAEQFIRQVRNEFERIHDQGRWAKMAGYTTYGVVIETINPHFDKFTIEVESGWNLSEYVGIEKFDELVKFDDYVSEEKWDEYIEICGFQNEDISYLRPFVASLHRKGFECYVDGPNYNMIAVFTL